MASVAEGGNPLKFDDELVDLLDNLENVKTYKRFKGWKSSFLDRFESFLAKPGIDKATAAYKDFQSDMAKSMTYLNKCNTMISKGDLTNEKVTVKGRNSLNELCKQLQAITDATEALIPSDKKEEKKAGYNKFQLGAILVRDGFTEFDSMQALNESLISMGREKLSEVADPQQLELFKFYSKKFKKFCDVMADLGLYEVMLACRKFAEEPEEEEPDIINITIKCSDGKTMNLELDSSETIGNIKDAIVDACGIPAATQIMKFRGKKLDNNATTLDGAGIQDGSVLTVEPPSVPITVNTMDGKKIKVMVDLTKPISEIKAKCEQESGIPAANQKLYFEGKELDNDNKSAADYGIKQGSELDLEPKTITVNVKTPDGKTIQVDITPKDTTNDIKKKIEEKTGIKAPRQVLKHNGSQLPGGAKTVKDMGINDGDDIKVEIFKVPITVNTMDGKKIKVMVDPTDKLGDIKKQLEGESGIPATNQNLFMNGTELGDDNKTAEAYGIKEGSELDLEPKTIKVTVTTPDGKKITVDVKPADSTEDIKKTIEEKTGIKVPRQVLKHNGKAMPNGKTVKDMGVKDGDDIKVEIFKVPITVNTMDGKKIKVMVDPTDKLGDIKKQLEEESGIPAKNQNLFMNGQELGNDTKTAADYGIEEGSELDLEPKTIKVSVETPDGKKITVEVTPRDTAKEIKVKVEEQTGIKAPRQVIKHNGTALPNGKTIKDMGIKDGDDLKCEIFKVPIKVNTMDGKTIKVMVDPTDKLGDIKKQLEDESGIPAKNQNLFMNGEELSDDSKAAGDYGIKEGSVLDLEPKTIKVSVTTPDGKKITVTVKPSDTADDIKAKVAEESGIEVPRQVLKHNKKELPTGQTVKGMGLKDGDDLTCEIFKVPITVTDMDGKKIKVMVDPMSSLGDIKKQLESESGLPMKNQKLFMNGEELKDNNKSAKDYGIKAGSNLDLQPHTMKINVNTPDGNKITIDVKPDDSIDTIKTIVWEKTEIETPRQVLKFVGNELKSGAGSAKDLGIREGSTLDLEIFKIGINVKTKDDRIIKLRVEPIDTVNTIKKMLQQETGMEVKKQLLKNGDEELDKNTKKVKEVGIVAGDTLTLDEHEDSIIFVDIKTGTLFALDRDLTIEKGALTPNQGNKLDFMEAAKDSAARDKIKKAMVENPKLGVAPQVVVQHLEVEDYDVAEAEAVKSKWGVNLKKREKNKKGEEFIFVDHKSGACGELARKKYLDMGFITESGNTLAQAEKDTIKYDKYIMKIRDVFNIKTVK